MIRKVDMDHPQGPTVTVQNTKMPGKPRVAVDAATGNELSRWSNQSEALVNAGVDALVQLRCLLESLGTDSSRGLADEIVGFLLEKFPEDEAFEDLLMALASYQPGGREYLYDEKSIRRVWTASLGEIDGRLASQGGREDGG